jgi:hypothetical protein
LHPAELRQSDFVCGCHTLRAERVWGNRPFDTEADNGGRLRNYRSYAERALSKIAGFRFQFRSNFCSTATRCAVRSDAPGFCICVPASWCTYFMPVSAEHAVHTEHLQKQMDRMTDRNDDQFYRRAIEI